jgi:type II secretory pathway pseudopilin PulG
MRAYRYKYGTTIVEILTVVAIIAVLVTLVMTIAARLDDQNKERLLESTFTLLNAALDQFREYGYRYKELTPLKYSGFEFPLDCNDFSQSGLENTLGEAIDASVSISGGTHKDEYSGSEALYFFLSQVPESQKMLDKIDRSLITDEDADKVPMTITVDFPGISKTYPLFRFIDPWKKTLRYDYYDEKASTSTQRRDKRNFPLITSAGPDGKFYTSDDITNR